MALASCTFDLPPPLDDQGIGGSGVGSGGTVPVLGGGGGTDTLGGSGGNGGSGGLDCAGKVCGDVCVEEPSAETGCGAQDCTPCPQLNRAVMGCSADGGCRVEACEPGWVDCNGDALGKSGAELAGSNGCERRFGTVADGTPPLLVPEETMNVDGQPEDWNAYEVYAVSQGCSECSEETDDKTERLVSPRNAPRPDDFIGYFRVTWDSSNLYLLAEAYDDHVMTGNGDATRGDGVVLLFDGLNDRAPDSGYGNDDNRLYIAVDGAHASFNRPLQQGQVIPATNQNDGDFCYRIEAQISWRFIVGFEGAPANGQFPPSAGLSYGFDISFNDWDPTPGGGEPLVPQHQNQSWWVDPGDAWWRLSQGFSSMQLRSGGNVSADAGSP